MGMAAILLNGAKPFEQIDNTLLTEAPPPPPPPRRPTPVKSGENCSSSFRE